MQALTNVTNIDLVTHISMIEDQSPAIRAEMLRAIEVTYRMALKPRNTVKNIRKRNETERDFKICASTIEIADFYPLYGELMTEAMKRGLYPKEYNFFVYDAFSPLGRDELLMRNTVTGRMTPPSFSEEGDHWRLPWDK